MLYTVGPTGVACDAYAVIIGPPGSGAVISVTPGGLRNGLHAYATGIPAIQRETTGNLLDLRMPGGAPAGVWTIYLGLVYQGAPPSPASAFALDTLEVTVEE